MTVRQTPDQDDFAAEPRSLDLREYWLIVRRRWRLVAVIAVLGALCGVEYSAHAGHTYTAQASVVVDAVTQGPQGGSTPVTIPVNMSTEQAIAQSAAVIQLAATKLGVPVAKLDASVSGPWQGFAAAVTAGTVGLLQNVLNQVLNNPSKPINWRQAEAAAIITAVTAGIFTGYAGDTYDGGTLEDEDAKKLFDLTTAVASEFVGVTGLGLYNTLVKWHQQGII